MKRALVVVAAALAACAVEPAGDRAPSEAKPGVRPQDDLYLAVNGEWLARTEIPKDRSSYGAFAELSDKTEADLHAIVERTRAGAAPGSLEQKVGDLYASFMDEARDDSGVAGIADELATIAAIDTKPALVRRLAELQREGVHGAF